MTKRSLRLVIILCLVAIVLVVLVSTIRPVVSLFAASPEELFEEEVMKILDSPEPADNMVIEEVIEGRVPDSKSRIAVLVLEEGNPVEGATVRLKRRADEPLLVSTDAQGVVDFDRLEPGHYACTVRATDLADGPVREFDIEVGQKRTLVYNLIPGWEVSGRVTLSSSDCSADEPESVDASLIAMTSSTRLFRLYRIDVSSDGGFTSRLPEGHYNLFARSTAAPHTIFSHAEIPVLHDVSDICMVLAEVQDISDEELEEILGACWIEEPKDQVRHPCVVPTPDHLSCAVHGRVVDENGRPVVGVGVRASPQMVEGCRDLAVHQPTWSATDTTAVDGTFSIEGILCVTTSVLVARLQSPLGCGHTWVALSEAVSEANVEITFRTPD